MRRVHTYSRNLTSLAGAFAAIAILSGQAFAAQISDFVGEYVGSAEVVSVDGATSMRDMSVTIEEDKDGFTVDWTTVTHKAHGRIKESSYSISFLPSERQGIYSAAMTRNVFGHAVQLDPMKGEPYVWGRIVGDTLTVYSLFVDDDGGYEMQQFDRTLADGGLMLEFTNLDNGTLQRSVTTFLEKQ